MLHINMYKDTPAYMNNIPDILGKKSEHLFWKEDSESANVPAYWLYTSPIIFNIHVQCFVRNQ